MTAASLPDREQIIDQIIFPALSEALKLKGCSENIVGSLSEETTLFGKNAHLDSLGLVNFIMEVEGLLSEKYDLSLVLASEDAMSRSKSPFRTVGTLAAYICDIASPKE